MAPIVNEHHFFCGHGQINYLISGWISELEYLSEIAESDPHCAYSAYVHGLSHKWQYFQRTIPGISHLFAPLEDTIRTKFLPCVIGRQISDTERKLFSFPCRLGGLGISDSTFTAASSYDDSRYVTEPLVSLIKDQCLHSPENLLCDTKLRKSDCVKNKNEMLSSDFQEFLSSVTESQRRSIQLNSEKGASSWLTCLPLTDCGYYLNRQEFHDALCLRYDWPISGMAQYCACGL